MRKQMVVSVLALALAAQVGAQEPNVVVRFTGGIGVIPVLNAAGAPNVVRGVAPAGPWRIEDLSAVVTTDGRIKVKGRGLLLAGGSRIGQNANQSVFATLICEASDPFIERSTTLSGVPLEPNGDFRIDDTLNPLPFDCASPVLLIRSSSSGAWFAAGIPVTQ